jgi:hypothetical protein
MRALTCWVLCLTGMLVAPAVRAGTVSWVDWTGTGTNQVTGTLTLGATTIDVTYGGSYAFAQTNGSGTNYWDPSAPYISATVPNAPPNPDIIGLSDAGTATITFSQPVTDPVIALVSWNSSDVTFTDETIQTLSSGCGYWGVAPSLT